MSTKIKTLIIGAGAYGNAIKSCILTNLNNCVNILSREDCKNFTEDLASYACIFLAVPSQEIRNCALWLQSRLLLCTKMPKKLIIVSTAKGIEQDTLLLPHQVLQEIFVDNLAHIAIAALSGPSFAVEIRNKLPTCVVLASKDAQSLSVISTILHTNYFKIYYSDDLLGIELGGALKNIIAMVAGAVDGLALGNNARAAVITRGLAEIAELGLKMGAKPLTFMGLSGLGDLILSCTSNLSRNWQFGYKMAKGENRADILQEINGVVEGIATAKSAYKLIKKMQIKARILSSVYLVLYENLALCAAVTNLLNTSQASAENSLS